MSETGTLLAWIKPGDCMEKFVAAIVGNGAGSVGTELSLERAPATYHCLSHEEAYQWIGDQVQAVGLPITWLNPAP